MWIDKVDYTPEDWETSVFCSEEEFWGRKKMETQEEGVGGQFTHAKDKNPIIEEGTKAHSKPRNLMNVSSSNSSENHCNNKTHPHKTKGVRSRKVNVELTVGREIELGEIPHYLKHAIVG